MKRVKIALCLLLTAAAPPSPPRSPSQSALPWPPVSVAELRAAVVAAPADALPPLDTAELDAALPSGDPIRLSGAASRLALRLARIELLGAEPASARAAWKIADPDTAIDLEAGLAAALAENRVGAFLAGLNPQHPDYAALRTAYAAETDPARRHVLAQNMERWRWMPRQLGGDYLLVNAASQEVRLWRRGQGVGAWRVIVGKPATPTPVFAATVTGVTFNPWWDVPANIVRESVGALMRRHPAAARARGYVRVGGRILCAARRPRSLCGHQANRCVVRGFSMGTC